MAKKKPITPDDTIQEFANDAELIAFLESNLERLKKGDNAETITQLEYQIAQLKSGS